VLQTLKSIGVNLGEQLDAQNQQLDRIEKSTDKVNDRTLAVTLRTTRLTQRTSSDKGQYIGTFQFISTNPTLLGMLAVQGETLFLSTTADVSTLFDCFLRYGTIVGMRSKYSARYVGCTIWGTVAVSGGYFGSQEECYFDFMAEESGLLCLARNWGAGGWLKASPLTATTKSVQDKEDIIRFRSIKCSR
jgi:hypothetical protein